MGIIPGGNPGGIIFMGILGSLLMCGGKGMPGGGIMPGGSIPGGGGNGMGGTFCP